MEFVIKHFKLIILGIWFLATILLLVEVGINNSQANEGQQFYDLGVLREQLELENSLLEKQLAQIKSLKTVEVEANQMGFIKATKVNFITTY